jgi:TatD DNase family protein
MTAPLFDSHCHVYEKEFEADLGEVLARARQGGVTGMIAIGASGDLESCRRAVALAASHADVWATVGVHPHDAGRMTDADFDAVVALAGAPRVVGIGESGLDYHYDLSPRDLQQAAFRRFARLSRELDRPLVVHIRDAHDDAVAILREEGVSRAVIHCFTGGPDDARRYLDLGLYISFSGIVTFKTADALREAARLVPPDLLLIETDAPFLAPIPLRGKRNEPAFIAHTAAKVAEVRGEPLDLLAAQTDANARHLFGL